MRPNAPQAMECHAPLRKQRSIGLSGQVRASANIIAGRFGQIGYCSTSPPRSLRPARRHSPLTIAVTTLHGQGPQLREDVMTRHSAPADAAASQPTVESLPTWDLGDLYPAPDSPAVEADFAKAEQAARDFAAAHKGRLAAMPGSALATAIGEYERIEEMLGRLMSYAQLLFSGDSTNAEIGRFYQTVSERVTDDQQPPAVLLTRAQPAGRGGAGAEARGAGAGQMAAVAARPACLPAAPACRRPGKAAAREGGDRAYGVEPAVR